MLKYANTLTDEEIRSLIEILEPSLVSISIARGEYEIFVKADVMLQDDEGSFPANSSFTFDDYNFECSDYNAEQHRYELRRLLLDKCGPQYAIDYLLRGWEER